MTEYTDLSPAVTSDGGQHWSDATPDDPNPLFIAPIVQDDSIASDMIAAVKATR